MARSHSLPLIGVAVLTACLLATTTGCGDHLGLLNYWMHGVGYVQPKFPGLEAKRVAVVCLDGNSLDGPGGDADQLAQLVEGALRAKVPDIQVVRSTEIANWIDSQDQDLSDYREVGRGVKADMVVGIDMHSFSIHEGQTLLKGRSKVAVKVFDMTKGGEVVYETPPKEFAWPENGARHVTENEDNFRLSYIAILANRVARDFYSYESIEDVALDAQGLAD
jgi:hypothetical protein